MPRYARLLGKSHVYHVMLRGNNKENIFIDDEDKISILGILRDKKKDGAFYLYAYCIMDNHIHLVLKEGKDSVSRLIKRVGTSYAFYFNKKYHRIGHVFQDRFKSEIIYDDRYLTTVIRYVHQNALKASIGTIESYRWSSYKSYISITDAFIDTEEVLGMFSNNKQNAIAEFSRFNHETMGESFIDLEEEKEIRQENIKEYIISFLQSKKMDISELKHPSNKYLRDELIKQLIIRSDLSRRGIADELGLCREMVRRVCLESACVSKEPSP